MTEPKREIRTIDDLHDLSTIEEVAEFFRQTPLTMRQWRLKGEFPNAFKPGRAWLIPKSDVISLMHAKYGNN